jgi:DUF4097 and DUF4098 domain-containing protein YvlB
METLTFPSPSPVRFVVEFGSGELHVETADRPDSVIEIQVRKGPDPEVTHQAGPDGTTITISAKKTRRQDYEIRIACPTGASFEVTTGSADMVAHGEVGSIDFRAGSGDLVFQRAAGDVAVKVGSGDALGDVVAGSFTMHSGSGDVRMREIGGDLVVKTASGDVESGPLGGDASVTTVSGDVKIASLRTGEAFLRSVSGDVAVGIAAGTRVFLDLAATSGDVRSDLAPSEGPEGEGDTLELHAATVSGDILVRRA